MTRSDYETIQTALGDALGLIQMKKRNGEMMTSELAFWFTAEVVCDYLVEGNKAFDTKKFRDHILAAAVISNDTKYLQK